ncbi:MAG TPA: IreB family regulatory phosphoprotein [Bacillota bacterium]|mgnify:CR=1 FL=1|nr:IreB family regulatory phosphoprotein [Bacillota bacterium]HPT86642.1 IreB family regulatory phosphoprotein [Bacillota bacterium]
MGELNEATRRFSAKDESLSEVALILQQVCSALKEKGYDPLDQIVGYLLSGDPAYITSHGNARILIKKLERDQILEELVQTYLVRTGILKSEE